MLKHFATLLLAGALLAAAAAAQQPEPVLVPWDDSLPPGTAAHVERALAETSRHGEFVDVALPDGGKLNCWVVYPERNDKAGVVLVVHDIRGMGDWIRAVADQLAQRRDVATASVTFTGVPRVIVPSSATPVRDDS